MVDKLFGLPLIVCSIYGNFASNFGQGWFMMKNYMLLIIFFFCAGYANLLAQTNPVEDPNEKMVVVDNFVLNNAVKMYPNPVQNTLSIQSSLPLTRVQVYSLLGELIKEFTNNFSRIDLSDLNSGIYMIKIHSNQFSVTKKLVKK